MAGSVSLLTQIQDRHLSKILFHTNNVPTIDLCVHVLCTRACARDFNLLLHHTSG